MNRNFIKVLSLACAAWVIAAPLSHADAAAPALPSSVSSSLSTAASRGSQDFLVSIYNQVLAHPEMAQAIQKHATLLQPGLSSQIAQTVSNAQSAIASGTLKKGATVRPAPKPKSANAPLAASKTPLVVATSGTAATTATWVIGGAAVLGAIGAGVALAASNGDGTSDAEGTPPTDADYAAEYAANWGLNAINATSAYDLGATGSGIKVGVLDSGIDSNFSEFTGRIASGGRNFIASSPSGGSIEADEENDHGVHVSGIIAANKNGRGMHGVAYEASVLPLRILEGTSTTDYSASPSEVASAIDYGIAQGVDIFNGSYGYPYSDIPVNLLETEFDAYERAVTAGSILVFATGNDGASNPSFPAVLPYVTPANNAAAAAAHIYVDNTNSKDYSALAAQLVAVTATDSTGVIAGYANRCGVAAAWCIAAPGSAIYSTVYNDSYASLSGTSMAAPHVSGALALLMDLYPTLTPAQVVTRLLTTANDTGIYADSSTYGNGMMDLSAATSFVSTPLVLTGSSVGGTSFALQDSQLALSSAWGDGLVNALSARKVTLVDSFDGATFAVNADALAHKPELSNRLDDGLRGFGSRAETTFLNDPNNTVVSWRTIDGGTSSKADKREGRVTTAFSEDTRLSIGYMDDPSVGLGLVADGKVHLGESRSAGAFFSPYLGFASDGFNVATQTRLSDTISSRAASFSGNAEDQKDQTAYGAAAELTYAPFAGSTVALQTGFVSEDKTFLGSETRGAFALGRTDTTYAGVSASVNLAPRVELVGSYFMGISAAQASNGSLLHDLSGVTSDAFSLGLVHSDAMRSGDRLGLIVNQPLRISGGSANITLPTSVSTGDLAVGYTTLSGNLAPSGRELDLELFYTAPLAEKTTLNTSVMYRHEPDHVKTADDEAQLLLRVKHQY